MNEEVHEIIIWATDFMFKASVGEKDILIIFLQQTSNKFSSSLKIFKFQMLLWGWKKIANAVLTFFGLRLKVFPNCKVN